MSARLINQFRKTILGGDAGYVSTADAVLLRDLVSAQLSFLKVGNDSFCAGLGFDEYRDVVSDGVKAGERAGNSVLVSDFLAGHSVSEVNYHSSFLLLRQFPFGWCGKASIESVLDISLVCRPLQIFGGVVRNVAVKMVDDVAAFFLLAKCRCNEAVNFERLDHASIGETDIGVSTLSKVGLQDATLLEGLHRRSPSADLRDVSVQGPNTSKVRDFIGGVISDGCPNFFHVNLTLPVYGIA